MRAHYGTSADSFGGARSMAVHCCIGAAAGQLNQVAPSSLPADIADSRIGTQTRTHRCTPTPQPGARPDNRQTTTLRGIRKLASGEDREEMASRALPALQRACDMPVCAYTSARFGASFRQRLDPDALAVAVQDGRAGAITGPDTLCASPCGLTTA
jgi:hypothetical protein